MFSQFKLEKKYKQISLATILTLTILLLIYEFSTYISLFYTYLFQLINQFFNIFQPVIVAFVIAYILFRPLVKIQMFLSKIIFRLTKRHAFNATTRLLSILLLIILIFSLTSLLLQLLIPPIILNIEQLIASAPALQIVMTDLMNDLTNYISDEQIATISHVISSSIQTISSVLLTFLTGAITNVTTFVLDTIIIVILTFYFLKDKESIFHNLNAGCQALFPSHLLMKAKRLLADLDQIFGNYIIGQLLAASMVGVASTILLTIIGHPFAIIIGLLAGLTNIIPYVGAFVGCILGFLLGLFASLQTAILSLVVLIIYNQLDGYIIQPKILGDKVGLQPIWIFLSILIGGNFFGAFGMILAVPTTALFTLYLRRLYYKKYSPSHIKTAGPVK